MRKKIFISLIIILLSNNGLFSQSTTTCVPPDRFNTNPDNNICSDGGSSTYLILNVPPGKIGGEGVFTVVVGGLTGSIGEAEFEYSESDWLDIESGRSLIKFKTTRPFNDLEIEKGYRDLAFVFNYSDKYDDEDDYPQIVYYNDPYYITQYYEGFWVSFYPDFDGDGFGSSDENYNDYAAVRRTVSGDPYLEKYGARLSQYNNDRLTDPSLPALVDNLNDTCPGEVGNIYGCVYYNNNRESNLQVNEYYDIEGNKQSVSIGYYNKLGSLIQNQSWDILTKKKITSKLLYDEEGRLILSSFSAPVTGETISPSFNYETSVFKNRSEQEYDLSDISNKENPSKAGISNNTIGAYYGQSSPEAHQDATEYPFSRTVYSDLNPGQTLKTIGGNKIDINGVEDWHQGFSYTFPVAQELYYAFGHNEFKGEVTGTYIESLSSEHNTTLNSDKDIITWLKATKSVVQDIHGVEGVVFTDTDGKTLASAKSGGSTKYPVMSLIGEQGFVDVHFPVGCEDEITFIGGVSNYKVWNLRTDKELPSGSYGNNNLPAGFYRIEYIGSDQTYKDYPNLTKIASNEPAAVFPNNSVGVEYKVNYYDYSLNEYDKAGRLIKTLQPLGFNNGVLANGIQDNVNHNENLASTFEYDALGQLIKSESPDEGIAEFKYREDGQIRFSQNSKQIGLDKDGNFIRSEEYSYTKYDALGRPVVSGVAIGDFSALTSSEIEDFVPTGQSPDDTFPIRNSVNEAERLETVYDTSVDVSLKLAGDSGVSDILDSTYGKQTFVRGNVSCTKNTQVETYYSYDIYGRVKWIVRYLKSPFINKAFTIDYTYDPVTSEVVMVDYQKHVPSERFVHKYIYNIGGQLTDVLTSLNPEDSTIADLKDRWSHQVSYSYYENGSLKRKELAKTIATYDGDKQIDYVKETNDPNKDAVLQGMDYVYNLSGQLIQINDPYLYSSRDPGGDENDAFGMHIGYYPGDYIRDNSKKIHRLSLKQSGIPQYNGNISSVKWGSRGTNGTRKDGTYYYRYDTQTNWLKEASMNSVITDGDPNLKSILEVSESLTGNQSITANEEIVFKPGFHFTATASESLTASLSNAYKGTRPNGEYNVYGLGYDVNGNIQSLGRNAYELEGSSKMDDLVYEYYKDDDGNPTNRLKSVTDRSGESRYGGVDFSGKTEYIYNSIGQLEKEEIRDLDDNIISEQRYNYNAAGLVTLIEQGIDLETTSPKLNAKISFFYDDLGQRVEKQYRFKKSNGKLSQIKHTYYVRDASGSVMSIYSSFKDSNLVQNELPLYGAGRVGIATKSGSAISSEKYELTDHLGNVRALVIRGSNTKMFSDYFPFGMAMPKRNNINNNYRYAYQGQEKDPETGKEAFELRLWDSRIGRWLTTDPAGQHSSPYLGMGNNPIRRIDPDGAWHRDAEGNLVADPGDLQDIGNTVNDALSRIQSAGDTYKYSFKSGFSNGPTTNGNFTLESSMFNANIDFIAGNMDNVGGIGIFSAEANVSYLNLKGNYKIDNHLNIGGDFKLGSASGLAKASTFTGEDGLTGFDFGGKAGAYLLQAKGIYNRTFDSGVAYDMEGSFNVGIGLGSNYSVIYDSSRQVLTAKGFVSATLGVGGSVKGVIHIPLSNFMIKTIEFTNHLQNHFK